MKSPSFTPSPTLYSDALNASLQSALGFAENNNLPFLGQTMGSAMAQFQREREEKAQHEQAMIDSRPSSVDFAKLRNSYLSPSPMDATENSESDLVKRESSPPRSGDGKRSIAEEDDDVTQAEAAAPVSEGYDYVNRDYNGNGEHLKDSTDPKDYSNRSELDIKREKFEH